MDERAWMRRAANSTANVLVEKFDPMTLPGLTIRQRTEYISRAHVPALNAARSVGHAMYQGHGRIEILPIATARSRLGSPKNARGLQPLRVCAVRSVANLGEDNKPVRPGDRSNREARAERIVDGRSCFRSDGIFQRFHLIGKALSEQPDT